MLKQAGQAGHCPDRQRIRRHAAQIYRYRDQDSRPRLSPSQSRKEQQHKDRRPLLARIRRSRLPGATAAGICRSRSRGRQRQAQAGACGAGCANFTRRACNRRDALDDAENQLSVAAAELKQSDSVAIDFAKFNVDSDCDQVANQRPCAAEVPRTRGTRLQPSAKAQGGGGATDIAQLADLTDMRCESRYQREAIIAKVHDGHAGDGDSRRVSRQSVLRRRWSRFIRRRIGRKARSKC